MVFKQLTFRLTRLGITLNQRFKPISGSFLKVWELNTKLYGGLRKHSNNCDVNTICLIEFRVLGTILERIKSKEPSRRRSTYA